MTPYDLGQAVVLLANSSTKTAATNPLSYGMRGRLTFSNSGWVILDVPNALGNGAFQALTEPGVVQPMSESLGRYNAHVSVIRPEELVEIGGADKIKERGQTFSFNLGPVREIKNPGNWSDVSKVWAIEVKSPELMEFRRSLGLGEPKYAFHLTFAIRYKKKLRKKSSIIHFYKSAAQRTEIKKSPVHGKGLFATKNFTDGETILPQFMTKQHGEAGKTRWEQSEQARFTNHSHDPNTEVIKDDGFLKLQATREITSGEELTADYEKTTTRLGPGFYYTYQGKKYGGGSDDGNQAEFEESDTIRYSRQRAARGSDETTVEDGDNVERSNDESSTDDLSKFASTVSRIGKRGAELFLRQTLGDTSTMVGSTPTDGFRNVSIGVTKRSSATITTAHDACITRNLAGLDDSRGIVHNGTRTTHRTKLSDGKAGVISGLRDAVADHPTSGILDVWFNFSGPNSESQAFLNVGDWIESDDLDKWKSTLEQWTANLEVGAEAGGPGEGDWVKIAEVAVNRNRVLIKQGESLAQRIAKARRKTKAPKSEAQADAGNYPKGKVRMHGFEIAIETGKGQTRSGTDANGKSWSIKMQHDYGDLKRTKGADGDPVDVFIGSDPDTELVFVVDQNNADGSFDEHKCMMGFRTFKDAKAGYLANYDDGWESRIGKITPLTLPQFKWWLKNGNIKKPCAAQKKIKVAAQRFSVKEFFESKK